MLVSDADPRRAVATPLGSLRLRYILALLPPSNSSLLHESLQLLHGIHVGGYPQRASFSAIHAINIAHLSLCDEEVSWVRVVLPLVNIGSASRKKCDWWERFDCEALSI